MHECLACSYCYVPADGVPSAGVGPGTTFDELPEDFVCPACGAPRERFVPLERNPTR